MTSKKSRDRAEEPDADRGTIGLGDLMRALNGLEAKDAKTLERIARSLGFSGIDANPPEESQGVSGVRQRPRVAKKPPSMELPRQSALPPAASIPALPDEVHAVEFEELKLPIPALSWPDWLSDSPPDEASGGTSVLRASLFPDRSAKGVLSAAVATRRPGLIPDLSRLVRSLTRGDALTQIPFRPRPSLHRGVQLLMDTSEAMTPFLEDLDDLAKMLTKIVGKHACELYQFAGNPNRAARWTEDLRELRWRPTSGRPVVLATDFGIGARAAAHDRATLAVWHRFVERAGASGVPVIAFVPYGRSQWPISLTRHIRFIHWDARTRASHIKKLFGSGHEVAR